MTQTEQSMAGRIALVTGAGGGIGAAIALHLAECGATTVIADRSSEGAEATAGRIRTAGGQAAIRVVDLSDRAARQEVIPSIVAEFGRIEILVNNAADHGARSSTFELAQDDWDRVIETNLSAPLFLIQAAARDMVQRGAGAIVNIAAIQAQLPVPTYVAYGASKGGLISLTKVLASELSPHGIRVNAVAPGLIDTSSFQTSIGGNPVPVPALLRRSGRPEELAAAVGFLASDAASYITGTLLTVDGGRVISRLPDPVDAQFRGYTVPEYEVGP
ncbi:MAG TPA: SDR family NAD(P)-dependent oxidoreductase [Mycobacteriales bacterium]|nr:SDR family NAD(P)-dependent oxidoreductase [Mycobacteriales bacterium]